MMMGHFGAGQLKKIIKNLLVVAAASIGIVLLGRSGREDY